MVAPRALAWCAAPLALSPMNHPCHRVAVLQRPWSAPSMTQQPIARRTFITSAATAAAAAVGGFTAASPVGAASLPPRGPSKEQLLEKAQGSRTAEDVEAAKQKRAELAKARMEQQRKLMAERDQDKDKPATAEIDADLRANYYYPTARKRYLPRIKAVADQIGKVEGFIDAGLWDKVSKFTDGPAEDGKLPLQLYASALTGQGLSLDVSYVKVMQEKSDVYAKELDLLKNAVAARDAGRAKASLAKLDGALQAYRRAAKIDTEDGGVGEVPEGKQGSSFSNNSASLYRKNKVSVGE